MSARRTAGNCGTIVKIMEEDIISNISWPYTSHHLRETKFFDLPVFPRLSKMDTWLKITITYIYYWRHYKSSSLSISLLEINDFYSTSLLYVGTQYCDFNVSFIVPRRKNVILVRKKDIPLPFSHKKVFLVTQNLIKSALHHFPIIINHADTP